MERLDARRRYQRNASRVERLAEIYAKSVRAPGDCWLWTGPTDKDGYGLYGHQQRVHRVVQALTRGKSKGWVLHRCGTRNCVNPAHLYEGTPKQNSADMINHGRSLRGSRHPRAKLSAAQVLKIRDRMKAGEPARRLAEEYGVARAYIYQLIAARRAWPWL